MRKMRLLDLRLRHLAILATSTALITLVSSTALATNWGPVANNGCVGLGIRKYSARLWNVPWGKSWEDACKQTPATVAGVSFSTPTRCENGVVGVRPPGLEMWGVFHVPDKGCFPFWDTITKEAVCPPAKDGAGYFKYSSVLRNIPSGVEWRRACQITPAPGGTPVAGRTPNRCPNNGQQWGEWDRREEKACCETCKPGCLYGTITNDTLNPACVRDDCARTEMVCQ